MDGTAFDVWQRLIESTLVARRRAFPEQLRSIFLTAGPEGTYVRTQHFQDDVERATVGELRGRAEVVTAATDKVLGHLSRRARRDFLERTRPSVAALLESEQRLVFEQFSELVTGLGLANPTTWLRFELQNAIQAYELHIDLLTLQLTGASARPLDVLSVPRYDGPRHHWESAEGLLKAAPPDVVNATSEAIRAWEAMAVIVVAKPTTTLGDALKALRKAGHLHPALAGGLEKIWGYASDEPGVRHAGPNAPALSDSDAQLVIDIAAAAIVHLAAMDTPSFGPKGGVELEADGKRS